VAMCARARDGEEAAESPLNRSTCGSGRGWLYCGRRRRTGRQPGLGKAGRG
jgi:hypothetical protein